MQAHRRRLNEPNGVVCRLLVLNVRRSEEETLDLIPREISQIATQIVKALNLDAPLYTPMSKIAYNAGTVGSNPSWNRTVQGKGNSFFEGNRMAQNVIDEIRTGGRNAGSLQPIYGALAGGTWGGSGNARRRSGNSNRYGRNYAYGGAYNKKKKYYNSAKPSGSGYRSRYR
jgi:hypothetical protein